MVRLVHFNDVHARFLPHDSKGNDCDPLSVSDCVGGSAYMRTLVDQLRGARDVDHAVVLNAGDELQGSIYATLFTGNMSAAILNTFHLDALALGNHEFDRGTDHLARYLAKVTAPAVCANLEFTKDVPQLQMMVQPFTVVDRHKLGVIGVLTQETMASSMVDNGARITDPLRAVNGAVKRLNQMGILRIVVLSHLGYEMDQELASNVDAGVSLIVGAHTHSYLALPQSDPLAQRAEDSKGTYPTWVTNHNDSEWQTAVVQAKSYGEYVGYLDLVFNTDGSLDSKLTRGKPVAVDFASKESPLRGLEPNKQVEKIMQPFIHKAQELTRQKIGMATQEFTRPTGNRDPEELALGNLIADAMVWADKKLKVAMLGTGALRGALPKGAITKGGLFTVLPYDDSLVAAQLTGAQILDVVRRGLSANNNQSSAVLSTLQVSGLRWTQNDQVEIRTKVGVVDARPMQEETWETVADASMYEVLMPGFLARGGDNLVQSVSSVRVVNSGYRDLVELYITKFSPIAPVLDHRK
ncbi:Metallo-dependent phosphatase-like protein [Coemansia spiralis]|nr:Metallo-dependent phosphatase-like protein [Coemansia spiralis]